MLVLGHRQPPQPPDQQRPDGGLGTAEHHHPAGKGQRLLNRGHRLVLHRLRSLQLSIQATAQANMGNAAIDINRAGMTAVKLSFAPIHAATCHLAASSSRTNSAASAHSIQ